MKDFTGVLESQIIHQNEHFFIIKDAFPVSQGHLLIISKKLRKDFFDLSDAEKSYLLQTIDIGKELIEKEFQPDGFNIGMNCGEAAGQTVFHFHCHLIPRYSGDMDDPRGGIRHCINGKGYY